MVESVPQSGTLMPGDRSFGRVVRSVGVYGVMTTVMALTPLVVFVPAALFQCALRNSRRAGWAAATLAIVLGVAYMVQVTGSPSMPADTVHLAWASFLAVTLSVIVPALLVTPMVQRGESFGRVVVFALLASAIGLVSTEFAIRLATGTSPLALQVAQTHDTAMKVAEMYRAGNAPPELVRRMKEWTGYGMIVLPAWLVIDVALVFILSLLMLGRLKAWRDTVTSRGETGKQGAWAFRAFTLPEGLLFAFVFGGLTPFATGLLQKISANVLAVVAFLYLLQGLAVLRGVLIAAGASFSGSLFALMFLGVLVFMGVGLLLLAVIGLFDPFFHFRNFKRKDESHESHSD